MATWRNVDVMTARAIRQAIWREGFVVGLLSGAVAAAAIGLVLEWWLLS